MCCGTEEAMEGLIWSWGTPHAVSISGFPISVLPKAQMPLSAFLWMYMCYSVPSQHQMNATDRGISKAENLTVLEVECEVYHL